jgi:hypothetical protein
MDRAWADIINRNQKHKEAELEARDAFLWFMDDRNDGPFSVRGICAHLDWDLQAVRDRVNLRYGKENN